MTVVSAATTSTTNITGFFIIKRGSSLAKAEPIAGHDDLGIGQRGDRHPLAQRARFPLDATPSSD